MENQVPAPVNDVVQVLVNLIAFLISSGVLAQLVKSVIIAVREAAETLRRNQPEWVQDLIDQAAMFGAIFAEKVDLAGMLQQYGRDKKALALEAAKKWLAEQGYHVDDSLLDAAIENTLFSNPEIFPPKPRG